MPPQPRILSVEGRVIGINFESLPRFKTSQFTIVCLIAEWASAYEVELQAIERQIPIAHAWCNANPKRAPRRDPVRFLYNWMRIAKKAGNLVSHEPDRRYREEIPQDDMTVEEMVKIRQRNMRQDRATSTEMGGAEPSSTTRHETTPNAF